MKFLIVDDQSSQTTKISENLKGIPDVAVLTLSSSKSVDELLNFQIDVDVALIDLRLQKSSLDSENTDGYGVCQKLASHFPSVLIVGYSSSLNAQELETESPKAENLKSQFSSMGADLVLSAAELSLTPMVTLKQKFLEHMKEKR